MANISLYGSNELINSDAYSMVTLTCVEALSGLVSLNIDIFKLGAKNIRDGDNIIGGSDVMLNSGHSRRAYEIKTHPFHWEDDFDDIDKLESILSKRSCFMNIIAHELSTTLTSTDKVIALAENGEWEQEQVGKYRVYNLYLVNRKRNA